MTWHNFHDTAASFSGAAVLLYLQMRDQLLSGGLESFFLAACGALGALAAKEAWQHLFTSKRKSKP